MGDQAMGGEQLSQKTPCAIYIIMVVRWGPVVGDHPQVRRSLLLVRQDADRGPSGLPASQSFVSRRHLFRRLHTIN